MLLEPVAEVALVGDANAALGPKPETDAGGGAPVTLDRRVPQEVSVRHAGVDERGRPEVVRRLDPVLEDLLAQVRLEVLLAEADREPLEEADLVPEREREPPGPQR